ncbi:CHAP domain-containing protein [Psychrobacter sp. FDAARGOS_221]|uniref:CHAP domain-containing protein n=1 Tax=Psychrobacter sp. FDAARGOS_221 TaxID=1975705 RepID=UPI000BB53CE5|nr:CHAP domain-containing protein [Psychrobacter sp. FDAARGOS_221]PNK60232.1 CHAP domain-containing protein [Psychrobacter sp. FDAARGOS_221]
MKKSLIILSLMGLSATQVNASVQHTYQPVAGTSLASASNTGSTPAKRLTVVNSFSNIRSDSAQQSVQSIESLIQQKQQSLDSLGALAQQQESKFTATSFATTANTPGFGSTVLDSSAPPAVAAARAARAAHSRTIGLCARYVRKALQSAGYSFTPNPSAYQYATRGTLAQAGFVKISNNTPPQIGDVVVYNRSSKHPHGHIQIYDGSQWVSDFRQARKNPYSQEYSYTTWRDARYLNDASNEGIYLAME